MSGDLGNLLTGELGEAEARFAHDDFSDVYGKRVMGRVRTRRAVRVAGVGGGTMLTAGALVLGATQIPWGVFGAAPGMGVSDCVTASPSDEGYLVTVTTGAGERASIEMVVTDPATGGVRLTGVEQADGVWVFTDADGNPVEATLIGDGRYGVRLSGTSGDFTYSVEAPDGAASPSPSDDCYTPSPKTSSVRSNADSSSRPSP